MSSYFTHDLVTKPQSSIVHGHEYPLYHQLHVKSTLHDLDGVEQLAQALEGKKFGLYGNYDRIGSGERINGDEPQRW
jgi:hypothetical protein